MGLEVYPTLSEDPSKMSEREALAREGVGNWRELEKVIREAVEAGESSAMLGQNGRPPSVYGWEV